MPFSPLHPVDLWDMYFYYTCELFSISITMRSCCSAMDSVAEWTLW